jgi:hypothetical protein
MGRSLRGEGEFATVPVRVTPTTHEFIISKAVWGESIDQTIRSLIRNRVDALRGKRSGTPRSDALGKREHATAIIRVAPSTHRFILSKARIGEILDQTLRRILGIPAVAHRE